VPEIDPSDDDRHLTESQRQWRDWAAHGYRKRYQPTSMLWFGGVFVVFLIVGLVTVVYVSAHGNLP
jgi:hypothetical protein